MFCNFNSHSDCDYILVLNDSAQTDHDVPLVPGEVHDGHGVRVLGVADGRGGAGPEARHFPAAALDGDWEVVE